MISKPQPITTEAAWETALRDLSQPHILQSWAWGEFKNRWAWQADRLLWTNDDSQPVAAAQVLARPIPYSPFRFLYVSKGPIFDAQPLTPNPQPKKLLADLETYARQQRALFIKIDPDVPLSFGVDADQQPHPAGQQFRELLLQRGWQFSPEQIQFRNTVLIDLRPAEDDILAAMKSKWRYNIRLARRKAITIRHATAADLPTFYQMYAETGQRDGFLLRPQAYYEDIWTTLLACNEAHLLFAVFDGQPIAGLMLFVYGKTAWYFYGASTHHERKRMPNHLLQWEAMRLAKQLGCEQYDMWGAPTEFAEHDPLWGVYRFKQGFGGTVRHGLGAWDYPVYPRLYRLFCRARGRGCGEVGST